VLVEVLHAVPRPCEHLLLEQLTGPFAARAGLLAVAVAVRAVLLEGLVAHRAVALLESPHSLDRPFALASLTQHLSGAVALGTRDHSLRAGDDDRLGRGVHKRRGLWDRRIPHL